MTMGIVTVASLAGRVAAGPAVTRRSILRRASSIASAGTRSGLPSADRHSMAIFFPSMKPRSRRPWWNASMRAELEESELTNRNPIRGIFVTCCASARGAVVSKTVASSQTQICLLIRSSPVFLPTVHCQLLSDNFIRSRQHIGRDRQADLFGGFQVDDELELGRLFDGEIGGRGALSEFIHAELGAVLRGSHCML